MMYLCVYNFLFFSYLVYLWFDFMIKIMYWVAGSLKIESLFAYLGRKLLTNPLYNYFFGGN